MNKNIIKINDIVEIVDINDDWLDIEPDIEDVIGKKGLVVSKEKFKEFGTLYQILVKLKDEDYGYYNRKLWFYEYQLEIK